VILAGRRINDSIGVRIVRECLRRLLRAGVQAERVTLLGLTFKENVVDIRNSRAIDIVREFQSFGIAMQVQDPIADPTAVVQEYGLFLQSDPAPADAVVIAVAHDCYRVSGWPLITRLLKNGRGLVMDVKGMLDPVKKPQGVELWRL
jgi:UDP-N-acetyl-D-glucosamine/UDP-N-acetyl-D-galactosamine dehydrogenase